MIQLNEFLEIIEYKIARGTEFQWKVYGPNARFLNYETLTSNNQQITICAIFDTESHRVYQIEAWDEPNGREYRWIDPDYLEVYKAEAKEHDVRWNQSLDDHNFIDLEVEDDIIEKASAIYKEEEYDERIVIELTLTKDEQFILMDLAHKADMKFNDFINTVVVDEINRITKGK